MANKERGCDGKVAGMWKTERGGLGVRGAGFHPLTTQSSNLPSSPGLDPPLLDLQDFKVLSCHLLHQHNHKHCPFFHSHKDRRRLTSYSSDLCTDYGNCGKGDECPKAHNRVEQLYHPDKYKTKFCTQFPDKLETCDYGSFCSFAHSEEEIKVELIHHHERNAEFYMYEFKTVWCPFIITHDKALCVYAHNWQDCRRNPALSEYLPVACQNWKAGTFILSYEQGGCRDMMGCERCHGWKELEYHPLQYKTKPCAIGSNCLRTTDCPNFHNSKDRREIGAKCPVPPGFETQGEDKENNPGNHQLPEKQNRVLSISQPVEPHSEDDWGGLFHDIAAFVGQALPDSPDLSAFYTPPERSSLALSFPQIEEIPRNLICPITGKLMHDPVIFSGDGKTYEYSAIVKRIKEKETGEVWTMTRELRSDDKVRSEIAALVKDWL